MTADLIVASIRNGQIEVFLPDDKLTYTADGAVTGGTLVEATSPGPLTCQVAGNASVLVVGVATYDAADGNPVTIATDGVWNLVAHGTITAGSRVIAYTGGLVADAGATPDARKVVGTALADVTDGLVVPVMLSGTLG